jgi:glycosyltransferase involved in cell wall biosynthesis
MAEFKFSLIIATLGRDKELALLLDSLLLQSIDKKEFEIIIVDQNDSDLIDGLVLSYKDRLTITHIKSSKKGLSYNRNIGIDASRGEYLCIPDDDCTYYPDTLQQVLNQIEVFNFPDMLIGKVFDRKTQQYIFKKTPQKSVVVKEYNFYPLVSSITIFFKKCTIRFDENFGIGATYPSNEDGDLILTFINSKKRVIYSPKIECNHPPYNMDNMSNDKLYVYGIGFGAMCRKFSSLSIAYIYIQVLIFQILMLMKYTFMRDKVNVNRRWQSLKGRINGFIYYKSVAS